MAFLKQLVVSGTTQLKGIASGITPEEGDNSQQLATTSFVNTAISNSHIDNVVISDTEFEPQIDNVIWVDTSNDDDNPYDIVSVNSTFKNLLANYKNLEERVQKIEYGFDHEICFGDFTNNVKTEESQKDSEEPLTETKINEDNIVLEDGTVKNIKTYITTQNFLTSDDNLYNKITTRTVTEHYTMDEDENKVVLQTLEVIDVEETLSNSDETYTIASEKNITSKNLEILTEDRTYYKADGTTPLITVLAGSVNNTITTQTISSNNGTSETKSIINVLTSKEKNGSADVTTTVTTTIDKDSYKQVTNILEEEKVQNNEYKTTTDSTETIITDIDKTVIELHLVEEYSEDGETLTTTTTKTTTVYDITDPFDTGTVTGPIITTVSENLNEIEDYTPNAKHLRIKMGLYKDLVSIINSGQIPFMSGELLYCYDKNKLFIVNNNNVVTEISGSGSGSGGAQADLTNVDEINFNTKLISTNKEEKYTAKIDENGKFIVYPSKEDVRENEPTNNPVAGLEGVLSNAQSALYLQKLYINMVYCGGLNSDEYSYNYCDYNFVELSNLTKKDIVLDGLSLQYSSGGTDWNVLPLTGVIKAQSTFLIRGAKCSVSDVNTTIINVPEPDMYWYNTYSDGSRSLIKFSDVTAKFVLMFGTTSCPVKNPFYTDGTNYYCEFGYIDGIGMNIHGGSGVNTIDGFENKVYAELSSNRIMTKYFTMDPVSQATKALTARNNANDWNYVDLSTANKTDYMNSVGVYVKDYTPQPKSANKNIFFNKTHLDTEKPNMVTCTFGIQATDNGSPSGATRCFNWVSRDYYNEYLWYRIKGTTDWTKVESFSPKDGTSRPDRPAKYQYDVYNRKRVVSTSGEAFTSHKYILTGLHAQSGSPVVYEYRCGRDESHWSDIYEFTIRHNNDVKQFGYVQVSDQQGFNADEYLVWGKVADYIEKKESLGQNFTSDETYDYDVMGNNTEHYPSVNRVDFVVNTGDMTQNGNRLNEWLDYYKNGEVLYKKYEQMYIIGNNDLCPEKYQGFDALGDGGDISKINHVNFQFFFTYEMDENNLAFAYDAEGKSYYIPSLYSFNYGDTHFIAVNSEITGGDSGTIGKLYGGADVYKYIKEWCEYDAEHLPYNIKFKVAFCHEQPFTIITNAVIKKGPTASRDGSHLNTVYSDKYWFSRFLENYGYQLCMCGHKHTYSCTRNLRENYTYTWTGNSVGPLVKDQDYSSLDFYLRDLVTNGIITEEQTKLAKMTNIVSMSPIVQQLQGVDENIDTNNAALWTAEGGKRAKYNAPVYAMCQATGYKQTSNKELPGKNIPWLRTYFPEVGTSKDTANDGQKFPFYIKWNVNLDNYYNNANHPYIRGDAFKVGNIMTKGKFNINAQISAAPYRIKANGASNDAIIISSENTVI